MKCATPVCASTVTIYASIMRRNNKYIIDTKINENYYIIRDANDNELFKISKNGNDLEAVKRMVGVLFIKEVI